MEFTNQVNKKHLTKGNHYSNLPAPGIFPYTYND